MFDKHFVNCFSGVEVNVLCCGAGGVIVFMMQTFQTEEELSRSEIQREDLNRFN